MMSFGIGGNKGGGRVQSDIRESSAGYKSPCEQLHRGSVAVAPSPYRWITPLGSRCRATDVVLNWPLRTWPRPKSWQAWHLALAHLNLKAQPTRL
jgi:hypothetical protein